MKTKEELGGEEEEEEEEKEREKKSKNYKAGSFLTSIESSRSKWRLYFSCRIAAATTRYWSGVLNVDPFP